MTHSPPASQVTIQALVKEYGVILIPRIQRDYAQGRPEVMPVRKDFLAALCKAIAPEKRTEQRPLNLDFVYGTITTSEASRRFHPVDGQQRLTTLFLLHWYLAARAGSAGSFRQTFLDGTSSRFSYAVRPTSKEFFDKLANFLPVEPVLKPSGWIENQPWFFKTWLRDPTIQSVLVVLDSIHELKFDDPKSSYECLLNETNPPITFQVCAMDKVGLSDDLYIKMNARGLPLTPFEAFKARYIEHLKDFTRKWSLAHAGRPLNDFVASRLDTAWSSFIWELGDQKRPANRFDSAFLRLLSCVALVTRPLKTVEDNSSWEDANKPFLNGNPTFQDFLTAHQNDLSGDFTHTLIDLIERWCENSRLLPEEAQIYFNESAFQKALFQDSKASSTALSYSDILIFAGYLGFLRSCGKAPDPARFRDWMRLVRNLAVNAETSATNLRACLRGLADLALHANDILPHLANMENPANDLPKHFKEQLREECLKAHLLLSNPAWKKPIREAENHPYLLGQIAVLLQFASKDGVYDLEAFKQYFTLFDEIFNAEGLDRKRDKNHLWERALLGFDAPLLSTGGIFSWFPVDAKSSKISWKRILNINDPWGESWRSSLRKLWDKAGGRSATRIDPYFVENQLETIVRAETRTILPHLRALIRQPELLEYCRNHCLLIHSPASVYLLSGLRRSGEHAELYTYALYKQIESLDGHNFKIVYKYGPSASGNPHIELSPVDAEGTRSRIEFRPEGGTGQFVLLKTVQDGDSPKEIPLLQALGPELLAVFKEPVQAICAYFDTSAVSKIPDQ